MTRHSRIFLDWNLRLKPVGKVPVKMKPSFSMLLRPWCGMKHQSTLASTKELSFLEAEGYGLIRLEPEESKDFLIQILIRAMSNSS